MPIYVGRDLLDQFESDAIGQQAQLTQESLAAAPPPIDTTPPPSPPPEQPTDQQVPQAPTPSDSLTNPTRQAPPALSDLLAAAGLAQPSGGAADVSTSAPAAPAAPATDSGGGPPSLQSLLKSAGLGDVGGAVSSAAGNVTSAASDAVSGAASNAPPPLQDLLSQAGLRTPAQSSQPASQAAAAGQAPAPPTNGQDIMSKVQPFLGSQYVWGGKDPNTGFDCSGLAGYLAGTGQPESTTSLYAKSAAIDPKDLKPGDLVFYNMGQSDMHLQHVGTYIGDGKLVQAGGTQATVNVADVNQQVGSAPEFRRLDAGAVKPTDGVPAQVATAPQTSDQGPVQKAVATVLGAPQSVADMIDQAANQAGIAPQLLASITKQESGFRQTEDDGSTLKSGAGALGLTQLMPDTARALGVDPNDPMQNLIGGARYLKQLLGQFGGDVTKAIAAYNAGPGAVQQYGGTPPYQETQKYVQAVTSNLAQLGQDAGSMVASTAQNVAQGAQNGAQDLLQRGNDLVKQGQDLIDQANQGVQSAADATQQKLASINAEADRQMAANQQASDQTLQYIQQRQSPTAPVTAPLQAPEQPQQLKPIWQQIGDTIAGAISQGLQPLFQGAGNALTNAAGALPQFNPTLDPNSPVARAARGETLGPSDLLPGGVAGQASQGLAESLTPGAPKPVQQTLGAVLNPANLPFGAAGAVAAAGSAVGGQVGRAVTGALGGDETAQGIGETVGGVAGGFAPSGIERAAPAVAGGALRALDVVSPPEVAYARTQESAPTSLLGIDLSAYPEDIRRGLNDFANQALGAPEEMRQTIAQWVKENPPPPPESAAAVRTRAVAPPAPTPPADNPFVLTNSAPSPAAQPMTADEIADHFDYLNQLHQTNDARINDLQAQLEASTSGAKVVHPPGTVGWTNAEVIAYARDNGLNPYSEDGWPHMAGDAAKIAQSRPSVPSMAHQSPAAIRQEIGQLQQQQSMLMDAGSRIANAGPEDVFYRPPTTAPEELPFGNAPAYTESNAAAAPEPARSATAEPNAAGTADTGAVGSAAERAATQQRPPVAQPPAVAELAESTAANPAGVAANASAAPPIAQPPAQGVPRQLASTTNLVQQMLDTVRARPDADPATLDALQQQLDQLRGGPRPMSAEPAPVARPAGEAAANTPGAPTAPTPATAAAQQVQQSLDTAPAAVKQVASQIGADQDGARAFDLNALAQMRAQYQGQQPPLMQTAQKAPGRLDRFIGYTISNMLWGVGTAAHITTSQALQTLGRPIVTAASGHPVDAARDATAMASSISDAFAAFGRTIQTGQRQGLALQAPVAATGAEKVLQFPLRLHSAINEFYRTLNAAGGAAMEASRRLRENPNLSFQDVLQRYPQQIMDAGANAAARATFMEGGGALKDIGQAIGKSSSDLMNSPDPTQKAAGLALRWVVPMTHIPAVILGEGIRGLPVVNEVRGIQRATQLARAGQHYEAQQEIGRTALTSFANMAILNEVAQGNITGDGPTTPADKERLMEGVDANGNATWRPNSIRLPDGRWLDYTGLGPIALSMSSIANLVDAAKEYAQKPPEQRTGGAPELAQDLIGREMGTIGHTWFLRGLADVLTAVKEGTVGGTGTQISQAGDRLVPFGALLNEARGMTDPYARNPQGPLERVESRLPFVSQNVQPRLAATTGQPEEQPHDLGSILFRGTPPGMLTPNPVADEVNRLTDVGQKVSVPYEVKSYKGAEQTPEAQQTIRAQVGQAVNQYVLNTISNPRYQGLDDAQKANAITSAIGQARSAADMTLDQQVARSPHDSALLQWSQTPQYAGISTKLPPEEIARQNWDIQQAKAKLSEYRTQYAGQAENRLRQDDPQAYRLSQRDPLDSEVIKRKKAIIDRQTGGALSQADQKAAAGGLVGVGATTLQPPAP